MENCRDFFYSGEELNLRSQFNICKNLGYKTPYDMNKEKEVYIKVTVCDKKKKLDECLNKLI